MRFPIRSGVAVLAMMFVAAAAAVIVFGYQTDIGQARERVATGSQIIQTACGPIEYAAIGDGPPYWLSTARAEDSTRGWTSPRRWQRAASA